MPKTKLHHKPTKEELDAEINKGIEEIEKEETTPPVTPDIPETPETPEEEQETPETPEEETPETPEEETPEPSKTEEEEEPEAPEKPDYEEKFKNSSAEALLIRSKTKKLTEVIEKAGDVPAPTEEEMMAEYPEWDVMSDFEKKLAIKNTTNDRRFEAISEATKEFKSIDTWNKKIDDYLADSEVLANHQELEGKEEEFKVFASKPSRRGADFEDLVSAFLYTRPEPVKHTGKMFEVGSGGINEKPKPKSNKISVADSMILRKTDYKKYLSYLKKGLIELESE
jgi:hypothetical protein